MGPGSSSMGNDSTSVGPVLPEELLVERGDGVLVDEEERDLGLALHAARLQDLARQPRPAGDVHRMILLLVGGKDVDRHCVEPARPSATS